MGIVNHVNELHPGGAILPSGRKWPSVFYSLFIFIRVFNPDECFHEKRVSN